MKAPAPNPYEPPQTKLSPKSGWDSWSPFQSAIVRQIAQNMTAEERASAIKRGLLYGLWCGISVAVPLQFIVLGFLTGNLNRLMALVGGALIAAHLAFLPFFLRRQRQILCSTEWARENGIDADEMALFSWRSSNKSD